MSNSEATSQETPVSNAVKYKSQRAYHANNREARKKAMKKYYQDNKERLKLKARYNYKKKRLERLRQSLREMTTELESIESNLEL